VIIPGDELLRNSMPSSRFPTLRLEVVPNRDSFVYRDLYNVPMVRSICRGTLRYEGTFRGFSYMETHIAIVRLGKYYAGFEGPKTL
jgi:hypothetical protein